VRGLPLAAHEETLKDCSFCPKMCRAACPVAEAEASEAATPTWKGALALAWHQGRLPLAGAVAEAAYKCTDCGLAEEHCLHDHRPWEAYAAVRAAAFASGQAPERARTFAARVKRLGNPYAADLPDRLRACAPDAAFLPDGARTERVLFPGCTAVRHAPGTIADARLVIERSERSPVSVASSGAGCCGAPLLAMGDVEGARVLASRLAKALAGAGEVLTLDPGCAHAMSTLWPQAGIRPRINARTVIERLGERLDAVRAAVRAPVDAGPIAYHDPCALARHRGVVSAPRALIEAATGRAPLEAATCREKAQCSGAGGPYAKLHKEGAARIRDRRQAELAETGATRIVTACPSAARTLGKGRGAAGLEEPPFDVITLLARAMR